MLVSRPASHVKPRNGNAIPPSDELSYFTFKSHSFSSLKLLIEPLSAKFGNSYQKFAVSGE